MCEIGNLSPDDFLPLAYSLPWSAGPNTVHHSRDIVLFVELCIGIWVNRLLPAKTPTPGEARGDEQVLSFEL